ncbi:TetR/AcrR family transcriptional regulator [Mycobacterium asiaticum]|uniref:TetR family transcriptional regulator n=1 Tax=Mycobacterium asiaticum TaxID=1790 RepID=A0A1A3UFG4_MYCAS|nr:TetR/AcrR family transcriptional regulator [Mycobacterium asiaticum]OBK22343.1 TetR family transcriptional regulator [Mycobacterium asiaticum]OBK93758.1 TetR family transcriptional regulator [Mycobacterium asiaticum]
MVSMDAEASSARPYRGVDATQRLAVRRNQLLAAGLDLLGAEDPNATELTVRNLCQAAGLSARYFYESFTDKDDFVARVYDWVIAGLAGSMQSAISGVPAEEQPRAGMAHLVRTIAGDARIGRLLFSTHLANAVVMRKRGESTMFFALLSGQHVVTAMGAPANDRVKAGAHFAVGGVGQTLSAWLSGDVHMEPDELADHLASLLVELTEPSLYSPVRP